MYISSIVCTFTVQQTWLVASWLHVIEARSNATVQDCHGRLKESEELCALMPHNLAELYWQLP